MAPDRQAGFTLMGVLFLVAVLGVGLAALGTVWTSASQREKEAELLFIGGQYRRAIQSYYLATPGADKRYPPNLADLTEDHRFPNVVRHLRKLYPDPITGSPEWGVVRREGGIAGVYSLSKAEPHKRANFSKDNAAFENAARYADWIFTPPTSPQESPLPRK